MVKLRILCLSAENVKFYWDFNQFFYPIKQTLIIKVGCHGDFVCYHTTSYVARAMVSICYVMPCYPALCLYYILYSIHYILSRHVIHSTKLYDVMLYFQLLICLIIATELCLSRYVISCHVISCYAIFPAAGSV